ncbi:hypothetical protein LCL61_23845 [Amycolatopsis coloradensis]|uniref:Uncharacterized protein n=1 Tax=Amycolatopsis coloradensis TaxID=76021 RepID=A0ACD5BGM1_9PSEU
MRNRIRMMVLAGAVGAASLALSAPGVAAESHDTGVPGDIVIGQPVSSAEAAALDASIQADSHGCSGDEKSNNTYVHVCFVRDGDKIFVKDDQTNSRSAVGALNFKDGGTWKTRGCLNPHSHASGIWVYCSFSEADENTTARYQGFDVNDSGVADHHTAWHHESTS